MQYNSSPDCSSSHKITRSKCTLCVGVLGQHTVRWSIMNKDKHWLGLTWQSWVLSCIILLCWSGVSYFPLSRSRSAFLFSAVRRKGIHPFISTPTASGGSSDKVAAQPGLALGLILWFQFDPACCRPLRPSSSPIMAVSFIMRPIKKDLIEWGATSTIQ